MSRILRWIAIAAIAGIALLLFGRTLLRPRPIDVDVVRVAQGTVEDIVTNSEAGTVESRARARLGAERAGRIAAIRFEEGAYARRGDVLVELDVTTARTQLAAARREVQTVEAAQDVAHSNQVLAAQNWERVDQLWRDHIVPAQTHDEARAKLDAANAELRAAASRVQGARMALRLAEDEIAHLQVRAPFDGVVARHLVEIGEPVIPGQAVIELLDIGRLFVAAPIDERDAGSLRQDQPARVTLDAYPGMVWPGHVSRVAPMVEELKQQNRTIGVEVVFDSTADRPPVRAGMTADVEIVLGRSEQALRVPTSAVLEGTRVLVLASGRARSRAFAPGRRNWEWTEVLSGLTAGEVVIASLDRAGLKDGAPVRPAGPASGAPR